MTGITSTASLQDNEPGESSLGERLKLSGRRLLVDVKSEDTIELTRFLLPHSRSVAILDDENNRSQKEAMKELARRGVSILKRRKSMASLPAIDVFFADIATSPHDPLVANARKVGVELSNLADIAIRCASDCTIGITGSAGKTTTTFLLGNLLRAASFNCIVSTDARLTPSGPGHEFLAKLWLASPHTWKVHELTSHHLEFVNKSPTIAVVLNIFPDHQDWHGSYRNYKAAKKRLLRFQTSNDLAILNFDDREVRREFGHVGAGRKSYFSTKDELDRGVVISNGRIAFRSGQGIDYILPADEVRMPEFQLPTALAAAAAAIEIGVPIPAISEGLKVFAGLPKRQHFLGKVGGVAVYDDSIAMNPRKALAGVSTFPDGSLVVVCGGKLISVSGEKRVHSQLEKNDLKQFCQHLLVKATSVVVFDEGGDVIASELRSLAGARAAIVFESSLENAVKRALEQATAAQNVLVSPVFYCSPSEVTAALNRIIGASDAVSK
jgi:UDP-N-acetylmuramoylalanine--D-glutamate ligase